MELNEWLKQNGLDINPILDGTTKRFQTPEDVKGEKSGWYIGGRETLPNGKEIVSLTVSDWRTDERLTFRSGGFKNGDYEHYAKEVEKKTKSIDEEKRRIQEEVALEAQGIWANSHEPKDHAYLQRKSITAAAGIRQIHEILLVPTTDLSGKIWGIQRIYPDGTKRFMRGQRKKGTLFKIPGTAEDNRIVICEGFATGFTLVLSTRINTYIAFDAGNLSTVSKNIRDIFPHKEIIICGDDDVWGPDSVRNKGRECAELAAKECGGIAVFPVFSKNDDEFKLTDFNDLHQRYGIDEVKRQIEMQINIVSKEYRPEQKEERISGDFSNEQGPGKEDWQNGKETNKINVNKKSSPFEISRAFLQRFNYLNKDCRLRYYQQDFYKYKNNHYQAMDDEWLKDKLNRWLIEIGLEDFAGTDKINQIMNVIKTKPVYIGSKVETPCFIDEKLNANKTNLIPLENGLFNIEKFINKNEIELIDHNSSYFYRHILPYGLDISGNCPTYEKITKDIFESDDEILAWEEVMGVHVFCPFLLERFFILSGEGANGKSVLRTILTCLLGSDNISTVPLECFNPNSFAFINTLGKLANIIPDMKDISEIDEGVLKQFISREPMIFNRKNKPYISSTPTAFLTVCTNVLPKFTDRSDGVWRRMILFNFKKEIPKEDQNPKFREFDFWNKSGELPGIFNRALAGILRVVKRGDIGITDSMKNELEEYRHELNFVMQFASDHLIFNKEAKCKSSEIYQAYKEMVNLSGGRPLGAPAFSRQLKTSCKKLGYEINFSDRNQRIGSYVGKVWWGVQLKIESFIPPEAHQEKT